MPVGARHSVHTYTIWRTMSGECLALNVGRVIYITEEIPMIKAKWTISLIAAGMFLLAWGEGAAYTLKETFEEIIPAEEMTSVRVDNTNGDIEVSSWDRSEVKVEALQEIKASNAEAAEKYAEAAEISVEQVGKTVEVRTVYPEARDMGGFWKRLFGVGKPRMSVRYKISVPRRMDLDLRTTNGQVRVSELEGEVYASSTNGKIRVAHAAGSVECRTTNGGIELREISGPIEAGTTNGGIDVDLLGTIGEGCRLKTVNGGITLSVPEDLSADIDAQTVNGSIRSELPLTVQGEIGKRSLRGRLNEGGVQISLRTVNGSIRIEKR